MKAGFGMTIIVAALAATPLFAQSTPAEQQQQETVGPRELRDFSLPGTTAPSQPAPQTESPPAGTPTPEQPPTTADRQTQVPPAQPTGPIARGEAQPRPEIRSGQAEAPPARASQSQSLEAVPDAAGNFFNQPAPGPIAVSPEATAPAAQSNWNLLRWFGLALLGIMAAAYLLYRQRIRAAPATAETREESVPVSPAQPLPPAHPRLPPKAAPMGRPASSGGIVSTALRPSLELMLTPVRCVIDDQQATVEFTISAVNSGNAPARDVRIEVALINAGPAQDQEIGRFFDQPAGVGEPVEMIPPMRSIQINSRVSLPLTQVQAIEAAGRRLFVPLLAFNALFRWSGGEGQTSLSYLVGREGEGDKMAPFRLDVGPRIFRNLGARAHHMQVRR